MQAQFNPLPLLSVKSGLDSSIAKISGDVEGFFSSAGSDEQALKSALEELHRMGGVLRMLSLSGLVVFCAEIERVLQETGKTRDVNPFRRDAIRHALFGLTHYLDALADGASNATLRLFHEYQEMLQARGVEMAFEVDLFFPSLQVDLPESLLQPPQEGDGPARIKLARMHYQQGLLKWLRHEDTDAAMRAMMGAVRSIITCVPQNRQRAYWWVAFGLLDCLIHDGIPPELNVKKSLSRIDLKMKTLTDGGPFDEEVAISETLYLIARSHSVSENVEQIKAVYALDDYLPGEAPLPPSETAAVLDDMRAELNGAEESWEQCIAENAGACHVFAGHLEKLYALSERLDRNTLQFLSKQIHLTALHADEPERAQRVSMDMAMALLLLNSGIEHYQHLGSGFQELARILSSRLQAGMARVPGDDSKLENLISLYRQMEHREVMVPLATEMQGNLQHIEQNLNAFFNNAAKRAELSQVGHLLNQVQGGLHILSLDAAVQLLDILRQLTDRYVHGETPTASEMRTVAAAVSALEDYVHGLVLGQKPDSAAVSSVLQEITELRTAAGREEIPAQEEQAAPAKVSIRTGGEDEELLEVFLEEARDVMETLRENLETSRLHMDSREPLVTMRRGFHTLKGSGRMVGLTEFGEVAWAVERAMNKWLQDNKPATPALLDMIGDAEVLFQHWIDMLKSGSTTATIDTSWLLTVADCIENGKEIPQPTLELEQPAPEVVPEVAEVVPEAVEVVPEAVGVVPEAVGVVPEAVGVAAPAPVEVPVPAEAVVEEEEGAIRIGSVSLSETLFSIATEEAASHVHALEAQLAELRDTEPHVVSYDFMRAAHTLAGVNRTMGFVQIAELAYALELWLEERIDKPNVVSAAQMSLIDQVVQRLNELCAMVREQHQEPSSQAELIAQLQREKEVVAVTQVPPPAPEFVPPLELELPVMPAERAAVPESVPPLELELPAVPAERAAVPEGVAPLELPVVPAEHAAAPEAVPPLEFELPVLPTEAAAPAAIAPEITLEFPPAEAAPREEPAAEAAAAPALEAEAAQVAPGAEEKPVLRPQQDERTVHDEVDEQLLPIFLEEAHELYPQIGSTLRAWREQPGDAQLGRNLQRSLHTLKGSARMAGAMRLGELTHRVEDRVQKAVTSGQLNAELWNELDNYFDRIGNAIEQLQPQMAAPPAAQAVAAVAEVPAQPQPEIAQAIPREALEVGAERAIQAALLRVRSDTVDRLVNEAGEVSVARSRAETELRQFKNSVLELTDSVNRLRHQLREIEIQAEGQMQARTSVAGGTAEQFDPLEFDRFTRFQELTRFMNESVHDVQTVQQALLKNLAETEAALTAQAHLSRDLHQGLMAIRMVPFASISERLYRIVRQTGKELNKRANLDLSGTEVELDRSVLERMTAPFEHLLRNSIAHGLETPERREQAHKSPIGEIRLALHQEANEVVFELSDDGAGLDLARIRQKAVEKGVIQADEELSDEQVMQLVFTSGISTAQEVTEISGRGIGMDVVRSEITSLGGRIDVASEAGHGVRFTIHLPLTLAVTKTLMVRAGQNMYALPSAMIENVQQLKPADLEAAYQQQYVDWHGARYPLYFLARLLGDEEAEIESLPHNPVLLLRSGDSRIAVHVDELHGNQESVVKNIGPQLSRLPGIAGATVSGSGAVILIINPIAFTQRIAVSRKVIKAAVAEVHKVPSVMVVDDSLTVRKITGRLLARAGYQVLTAKDGVDALEQLGEVLPDVMLLDVEMPRMDGFELARHLRQDKRTQNLPIIMITSRTADKHRRYAIELGVNEYMGKPYQEEELLEKIASYVKS